VDIKTPGGVHPNRSFYMDHISKTIKKSKLINNVINVNVNNSNNVNNDNNGTSIKDEKYALNRNLFKPHTEETQLAETIATFFNDLQNYAFYLSVVKKLGATGAYAFWNAVKQEIEEKRGSRYEIRLPHRYFAWKYAKGLNR
jgi:hypothetical protein